MRATTLICGCTLASAMLSGFAGCAPNDRGAIQSMDAGERIKAIHAAGERRDREAVPLLVDRLEDEDPAVRFFAIQALHRITGRRFGYHYGLSATQRTAAVERWRSFVGDGGHLGEGPPEPDETATALDTGAVPASETKTP